MEKAGESRGCHRCGYCGVGVRSDVALSVPFETLPVRWFGIFRLSNERLKSDKGKCNFIGHAVPRQSVLVLHRERFKLFRTLNGGIVGEYSKEPVLVKSRLRRGIRVLGVIARIAQLELLPGG